MNTYEIYTVGGGSILFTTFNAIASLLKPGGSLTGYLTTIGTVVGFLASLWYTLFRRQHHAFHSWFLSFHAIMLIFIAPVSRVHIKDTMTKHTHVVDNVPFGLAFVAGTISTVGHGFTQAIETVFQPSPDYHGGSGFTDGSASHLAYTKTGMIFGAIALQQAKAIAFQNDDINENFKEFVGQCVTYDAMLGRKYTLHDLRNSSDIWGLISAKASQMRGFPWRDVTRDARGTFISSRPTEIITCKEGVARFNALLRQATQHAASDVMGRILGTLGLPKSRDIMAKGVATHLPGALNYLTKQSRSASDILKQQIMITSVVKATQAKAAEFGAAPNPEVARAYFQKANTYLTVGQVIAKELPAIRNVLEALCYGLFIFVMALVLLPNGFKIMGFYGKILLWLQLWSPLFALLNFIMTEAITWGVQSSMKGAGGLTIANIVGVNNMAQDIAGIAGYLCASIPMIAWMLLERGGYAFVNMAGSLAGVSQGAASSAAQEAVTGNYAYGNVSLNGFQNENRTFFQQQMGARYSSPGHSQFEDGRGSTTYASDGFAVVNQAMSNLPVSIRASEAHEQVIGQLYNEALSVSESESKAAERSQMMTASNYLEIGRQASHQISNGQQWSDQETANVMREAATNYDKMRQIGEKYGINELVLNDLRASISGGLSWKIALASLQGSIQKDEVSQASIDKAREEILNLTKSDSFRTAEGHMQQYAENRNHDELDSNTKQSVENFSGHYQKTLQHSDRAQKALDTSKALSDELRNVQTNATSIDANYTQDMVNTVGADRVARMSTSEQMQAARSYRESISNGLEKKLRSQYDLRNDYNTSAADKSLGSVEANRDQVFTGIRNQSKKADIDIERGLSLQGYIMLQTIHNTNKANLVDKEQQYKKQFSQAQTDMEGEVKTHADERMGYTQPETAIDKYNRFKN